MLNISLVALATSAVVLTATATTLGAQTRPPMKLGSDAACTDLAKLVLPPQVFDLPSGAGSIDTAALVDAVPLAIAERGPTPAARVTPATPRHCRVVGRIAPVDPSAPPIRFQINLPLDWNGNSVQFGGGGFNGTLITAVSLPPASRFERPSPLAQGYVTYGTDSGHETKQGESPAAFALNDEAFLNFAHASYKKVKDAAVAVMKAAYKKEPINLYFVGSSEGGREGLTMAQRYPDDFDGVFARVPVINWTALNHASARAGLVSMGAAWLSPTHVKLVHEATLKACDAADGTPDKLIANPTACQKAFKVEELRCKTGAAADACLNDKQIAAVQALRSPYKFLFKLANGTTEYPAFGVSGEAAPNFGPTGGWMSWWTGTVAPAQPTKPGMGIAWIYGAAGMSHVFARNANLDVTTYKPADHQKRVQEVSALMDSTNPDLSRFKARGGKLVILENMADYAQSPYAGIRYFESVERKMGKASVAAFARLYTAPGVDHVGSGAPANVDMLDVLADWVERGKAPGPLEVVQQAVATGFPVERSLPLCQWPLWPKYRSGDPTKADSFTCSK
jgi:hypothetical protein